MQDLIKTLREGDSIPARRQAALALGTVEGEGVVEALAERLRDEPDGRVREDITSSLARHSAHVEPFVRELAASERQHDRFSAAHLISKLAEPKYFDVASQLASDEDPNIVLKAFRAAVYTGGAKAAPVLAARLGEGDDWMRDALADAFKTIGAEAVPVLVEALASESVEVRAHAAETLGYLGDDAVGAIDALAKCLTDEDDDVRLNAVSTLGQLGPDAADALRAAVAGSDPMVSAVAKRYLERL